MKVARAENLVQLSILLLVGSMAGAASFTHVHDWTMANTPPGTGDWFGWANAIISELTPIAAALEIRRRKRHAIRVGYPMAVLILAATLSIAAQLAVATPSPSGWLLSALPALAFLALSKLVLSYTPATEPSAVGEMPTVHVTTQRPAIEDHHPDHIDARVEIPAGLLTGARMAAHAHHHKTGHHITTAELADHLNITQQLAATVLHTLNDTPTTGERP